MPKASIVVPAYNAAKTLPETLRSLLAQTFDDFEIVIVDDGSSDETPEIALSFCTHPNVRVVRQPNRGLAGARNTGIAEARGVFIGFCDADDLWLPTKLARHVAHLEADGDVGLSFTGSELMDDASRAIGITQSPRLRDLRAEHVFKRNPIGNGSSVVARRAALEAIAYRPRFETRRDWVFDETFRQSEDIECWLRLVLMTDWLIEGIPGALTRYRVSAGGLSAGIDRQFAAWERMLVKLRPLNPAFFERHTSAARAYQQRYLARRAISNLDGAKALPLAWHSMAQSYAPLREEPVKTMTTFAAALGLAGVGEGPFRKVMDLFATLKKTPQKQGPLA